MKIDGGSTVEKTISFIFSRVLSQVTKGNGRTKLASGQIYYGQPLLKLIDSVVANKYITLRNWFTGRDDSAVILEISPFISGSEKINNFNIFPSFRQVALRVDEHLKRSINNQPMMKTDLNMMLCDSG